MTNDVPPFAGRLRLAAAVEAKLRNHHLASGKTAESFSYALGHAYRDEDGQLTIVLADPDAVLLFAPECFVGAGYGHVTLDKAIKAQVFHRAVEQGYTAVVDVHDHHFAGTAHFSGVDDHDDLVNARYVRETVQAFVPEGRELSAAALLITRGDWDARVVHSGANNFSKFQRLRVDCVGEQFDCLSALGTRAPEERLLRHQGVVTGHQQELLRQSHAVVVGGGGTGSIAVECLARLGFGAISVIDADCVEATNLNRLQGAGPRDIGRLKVHVLADWVGRIAPQVQFTGVPAECFDDVAISAIESADLLIGCVDNPETRWWLNRVAVQYMIPWFDCGVVIQTQPQVRHELRASVVLPGVTACGHCAPVDFHPRKLPTRFLDRESLRVQRAAGYVAAEPAEVTPSAYPVNLQAVAFLMQEVLNWYCGWNTMASSIYWRSDQSRVERVDQTIVDITPERGCPVCDVQKGECREAWRPSQLAGVDLAEVARAFDAEPVAELATDTIMTTPQQP